MEFGLRRERFFCLLVTRWLLSSVLHLFGSVVEEGEGKEAPLSVSVKWKEGKMTVRVKCGFLGMYGHSRMRRLRHGSSCGRLGWRMKFGEKSGGVEERSNSSAPNPRRERFTTRQSHVSSKTGDGVRKAPTKDEGRMEDQRWSTFVLSAAFAVDGSFWRQLDSAFNLLVGDELAGTVLELGTWLVQSFRFVLDQLVNSTSFEKDLVSTETEELEMVYGLVSPNSRDKYYVDPLEDWQLTNVTYYLDR